MAAPSQKRSRDAPWGPRHSL